MRTGENAHQDGIHIFLYGCFDDHFRRLANACINHFHSSIAQRARYHLCPAIMSIQTRLGN